VLREVAQSRVAVTGVRLATGTFVALVLTR